ncbi:MAG: Glu/Leu/Phe/Val dehydrogenase [Firmicutes bacterium]|nr:Glu/Leu/Phe/Val dehydrogenase [Bacillota bacterium]
MRIFEQVEHLGHEQLVFCYSGEAGLKAVIAIHDTTLGPSLGGVRMWPYTSEAEAVRDALRLSMAMTYKSSVAGLDHGGGKAVVIADPRTDKSEALFRALGRFIEGLQGRYIAAEDVGTRIEDMDIIRSETRYVTGVCEGFGGGGNPAVTTAFGVFRGIQSAADEVWGSGDLAGKRVAVQGLGNVGANLCRYLREAGAHLTVTDIYPERVEAVVGELGAAAVAPEAIYDVECDIFSPNALGAVMNDGTIPRLKCKVVAGAANNQLAEERHGERLADLGILFAPDYVVNAGGVIHVADELLGFNRERMMARTSRIYDNLKKVLRKAREEGIPPFRAADLVAEERIRQVGRIKRVFTGPFFKG